MPVAAGTHKCEIIAALDEALELAASCKPSSLPGDVRKHVSEFSAKIDMQATAAFNNILTCLAANAVDTTCDPRYHRRPSGGMPAPGPGRTYFSGRGISENVVYPWLAKHGFRGAMSGWQTRVFERPQPYLTDYPEHISHVRDAFLSILDAVANGRASALEVIAEFFRFELKNRESQLANAEWLAKRRAKSTVTIAEITDALAEHFTMPKSARLPVLAIQALYDAMMPHVARYDGMELVELSEHSAADEHTGAVGDVEVIDCDGDVFEAVEVKHEVVVSDVIIKRAYDKVRESNANRYYILSTSPRSDITSFGQSLISDLSASHGCQMVVNGVLPTIKYYLRLLDEPATFLDAYTELLVSDRRVTREQVEAWKSILGGMVEPL